ncbi:MAG: hypothetical protein U1E10_00110 [Bdellovibrionales bacterium]|nr:hypothetical protein [Bdellovibrionales bacterium]
MRFLVRTFISAAVLGGLSSCNYSVLKSTGDAGARSLGELSAEERATMMNYPFINSRVLQPRCVSCHRSGEKVNLETYESVFSQLAAIDRTVFIEQTMPKRGQLKDDERRWLGNWLRAGAPLNSPQPPPTVDPFIATYDSIRQHVFEPLCMACHNPTGTGKQILLDRQSLLDSPLVLIDLVNVDESGLLIALERTDNKRMPPAEEGYSALAPEQIKVIREWISNGAN